MLLIDKALVETVELWRLFLLNDCQLKSISDSFVLISDGNIIDDSKTFIDQGITEESAVFTWLIESKIKVYITELNNADENIE